MTRLFIYIGLSLAVTALSAALIGMPGTLLVEFAGYRVQPRLGVAIVGLLALVVLAIGIWAIVRRLIEAPRRLRMRATRLRRQQGVDALSDGYIALEAGDPGKARQLARMAQSRLPENAAAQLLEARAALGQGDMGAAREQYRGLISNPKTALAALSGLFEQARAQRRPDVALTFARKAVGLAPHAEWAEQAVLNDLSAKGDWLAAIEMANAKPVSNRSERAAKRRLQAVLQTALATNLEADNKLAAFDHAEVALKLQPDFVPAALILARAYINRAEARKAASLMRRLWRTSGHPHVAQLYANVHPGSSPVERLARTRELLGANPSDRGAAIVLGEAAAAAFEWSAARSALAPHLGQPTQAICLLMADIEEGQNADQGKAREWLGKAVRAPRDPAWVADGVMSETWAPLSPVTGKLDAFKWGTVEGPSLPAPAAAPAPAPAKDKQKEATPLPELPAP